MSCILGKEEQLYELVVVEEVVEEKEYLKGHFEMFEGRLGKGLKEMIYSYSASYSEYSVDSIDCFVVARKEYFGLGKNALYDDVLVVV